MQLCGHGLLRGKVKVALTFRRAHARSGRRKTRERAVLGANVFRGEMGRDRTSSQKVLNGS